MRVLPSESILGAYIEDVDLACLTEGEFETLYAAFLSYKVLFIRNQTPTPDNHLVFTRRLGEVEAPHPFFPHVENYPQISVIATERGNPPGRSFWHTDMTWQPAPPKCSVLVAQYLPERGGDTIWLSMEAVYETLPEALKRSVQGKYAKHAVHGFLNSRFDSKDDAGNSQVARVSSKIDSVEHPMVVQHPETGKPTLYINEQFTRSVVGMGENESEELLNALFLQCRNEAFQVRLTWEAGTVAIWDNRCTQHFAVTDYGDEPRRLHRVVVKGEPPKIFSVN